MRRGRYSAYKRRMDSRPFVDFYESLQVSCTADAETIHRVYRILAQRFHPDNRETGNLDVFRSLTDAYHVLGDPIRRAAYDVRYGEVRRVVWKIFDQSTSAHGVDSERRKRDGVLALLYRRRVSDPHQPTVSLKEMEELLGVPREHLEFALWYLRENQHLQRTDNARYSITPKGVDAAEVSMARRADPPVSLLSSAELVA
jgi:curved DNA-binding protein CbpA